MRPGPRPMPTALKVLRGTTAAPAVGLPPSTPVEPRWSDRLPGKDSVTVRADAARVWATVVPDLDRLGLLAQVDQVLVEDLCVCVARLRQCERALSREGLTRDTERGVVKNPAATIAAQYRTQLRAYIAELGLSPSARSRLHVEPVDGLDDLERLLS